eukprot:Sspe_Gene.57012::Locus_31314_Transcript_1_1_Confidence_1.000_Length_2162::g.57012::m.57012
MDLSSAISRTTRSSGRKSFEGEYATAKKTKKQSTSFLSLRMTIVGLCVFCTLISIVVSLVPSHFTADKVIEDENELSRKIVDDIEELVLIIERGFMAGNLGIVTDYITDHIHQYTTRLVKQGEVLRNSFQMMLDTLQSVDTVQESLDLMWAMYNQTRQEGMGLLGVFSTTGVLVAYTESKPSNGLFSMADVRILLSNGTGVMTRSLVEATSGRADPSIAATRIRANLQDSALSSALSSIPTPLNTTWIPTFSTSSFSGPLKIFSVGDGLVTGAAVVGVSLQPITKWLSEMKLFSQFKHYRAFAFTYTMDTAVLVTSSHGEVSRTEWSTDPITGEPATTFLPVKAHNSSDYIIRSAMAVIDGRLSDFSTVSPAVLPDGTAVHILVRPHVHSEESVAPWKIWMVAVVGDATVVEAVAGPIASARADQQTVDAAVKDSRDSMFTMLYGLLAALALVLTLISLLVAVALVRPIQVLEREMSLVSVLELEKVDLGRPFSWIKEVADMEDSFHRTISMIREFRTFVPASLLHKSGTTEGPAAEAPSGVVTVVFVDILESAHLWETSPEGMSKAVDFYSTATRRLVKKHHGYEVKTIGDIFLISFTNSTDAVLFSLSLQRVVASNKEVTTLEDNELKIRAGIHCGEVISETNPITGRQDYRGTVVNKAARVLGMATGGTVCVTEEIHREILASKDKRVRHVLVKPIGEHTLK